MRQCARKTCLPDQRLRLLRSIPYGVGDEAYAEAAAEFSEKELLYLTSAVSVINVWNRYGVAYRWTPPGRPNPMTAAAS